MLDFGRAICSNLRISGAREWLVTNGIGGYASGTIACTLARRYHGLLVAALKPPVGRTVLVSKLDETASYGDHYYPLFANRWESGVVEPDGFHNLERFHMEGTTPVWTYACADALLEKRVWMQLGANTTFVRYDLRRATAPLSLTTKALVTHRDHHGNTRASDWPAEPTVEPVTHGLRVLAFDGATPLYLLSSTGQAKPVSKWYLGFHLGVEAYRGLDAREDLLHAGDFGVTLQPGESLTLVLSTEKAPNLDGVSAYAARRVYEHELLARTDQEGAPPSVQRLVLAADQFIVKRSLPDDPNGQSVIAGYPWFSDWGRDTMISLPGLTLTTGRPEIAACILQTFACFVDRGMLPNRFPDAGEEPEYNTVDATLWYFEAIRAYHAATGDSDLVRGLFAVLQDIIAWHQRGTRYNIHLDPADGLLYAGTEGVQLTWMDAKVGDWVVTPRIGKPVEVNALWHNALQIMCEFAHMLGESPEPYVTMARQASAGFSGFWNEVAGYCYDVIDGPEGKDPTLRPNQLFAVSLPHSPLPLSQQRAVVNACARHLLTSHGLRSLTANHPAYAGHYGGNRRHRDGAYHQGTVWAWLIGPFVRAHLRVYQDASLAQSFLRPLLHQLTEHGIGSLGEIYDGDSPFTPRGCIAQAWSVAEVLSAWQETAR
jgi:predicted glycogen debranching enzyme